VKTAMEESYKNACNPWASPRDLGARFGESPGKSRLAVDREFAALGREGPHSS
jgi:hypothetical protein